MIPPRRLPVFLLAACTSFAISALAASFTPGNVVVYRAGDGSGGLLATGNAVFLDEYTPAGMLVQSVGLPTIGSGAQKALLASGSATSDGLLTRSSDGTCLAVPGYARDLGSTGGNLTSGTVGTGGPAIPRVVARVGADGSIDTRTALTDAALGSNFRGATSIDCTSFWVSGTTGTGLTGGGVRYATLGATTSTDLTASSFANTRAVAVQGGQLYMSASVTALRGVAALGSGTPTGTLAGSDIHKLPGVDTTSTGAYAFFFADLSDTVPGMDTLYVADESVGLEKFSLVGGTWVANGVVGDGTDVYRGITGTTNGTSVTLYATRRTGTTAAPGGELVVLGDASGYNGALGGTPTVIATAASNRVFRGVALAPAITITPSAGAHGAIAPSTPQVVAGGAPSTFTVTPDAGYSTVVGGTCGGSLVGNAFTTDPSVANCTVVASFTLIPTYVVTPSAGAHGTIAPATPRTLQTGSTTSFTVTPEAGYAASVGGTCGGTFDGTTYTTAPVIADCTVSATFTLVTYTVTSSAGANGTITPSGAQPVPATTTTTFSVVPNAGYTASVGGTCGGTLAGTTFITAPINADCTIAASFAPLPHYNVTAGATGHGSIAPTGTQSVLSGATATVTLTPAAGYHAAVRGTCGGTLTGNTYVTLPITADCTVTVAFAAKLVLFVGNSYTFGRADPVMSYNAANVTDLTWQMWLANPSGSNDDEPHPWGGIPGVFKKLVDEAGLDYDVSISARNAATLRGHYLNSNPAGWDLRDNVATQSWDVVVLQDQSDEPLPAGRGANANLPYFNAYVDKLEAWVHQGAAETYTETQLFGGTSASCQAATGASASACDTPRVIAPANPDARAQAEVILYETWARPDMIGPNGNDVDGQFYTAAEGIEAMTADLHAAYFGRAAANPRIADVAPVGDAFLRAVHEGIAMRDPYVPDAGKIDLWYTDYLHPSKYGSYLSALVHYATITGRNPAAFGPGEQAAADLGIAPDIAVALQRIARETVFPDTTAPILTVPTPITVDATAPGGATVTYTVTGSDDSGVTPSVVCAPASGSLFAIGTTTVACTGTDSSGNAAHASFTVTVRGAPEQTARLIATVLALRGINVSAAVVNAISTFLQSALAYHNGTLFCATVSLFTKEVALLSGHGLPATTASALIAAANQIRAVEGCR